MLYICISKTEDSPPDWGFLGFFLPRPAEKQARRGGHCRLDNFFQVPCSFFYLPDNFSQVLFSFAEAAGGLFPKVKNVKVEGLGRPDFPVGTRRGQGRRNPKGRRLHRPEPGQDDKAQAFHKAPAKGKKLGILMLKCVFHFTKKRLSINFTYICRVKKSYYGQN